MKRGLVALALILLPCLLTACGFEPVYGKHGDGAESVAQQLNSIAIDNIPDRKGQILRNELIDRMYGKGRPRSPAYHLKIKMRVTEEDLGIQANDTSTRSMIDMFGDYQLADLKGHVLVMGTAHSVTSFDTQVDEYGNLAAQNDALSRTAAEVGEQIINRLNMYFAEKDEGIPAMKLPNTPDPAPQEVAIPLPNAVSLPPNPPPAPTPPSTYTNVPAMAPTSPRATGPTPDPLEPAGGPLSDPRLPPAF